MDKYFLKYELNIPWSFELLDDVITSMASEGFEPLVVFHDEKGGLKMVFVNGRVREEKCHEVSGKMS